MEKTARTGWRRKKNCFNNLVQSWLDLGLGFVEGYRQICGKIQTAGIF